MGLVPWRMSKSSLREQEMGVEVERESPGRNNGIKAWKSLVYAGSTKRFSVAEESVALGINRYILVPMSAR